MRQTHTRPHSGLQRTGRPHPQWRQVIQGSPSHLTVERRWHQTEDAGARCQSQGARHRRCDHPGVQTQSQGQDPQDRRLQLHQSRPSRRQSRRRFADLHQGRRRV